MKLCKEIKRNKHYIKIVGIHCKHLDADRFLDHFYNLKSLGLLAECFLYINNTGTTITVAVHYS